MSGEQWRSAPSALVESVQRSLAVRGGECVTVRGGEAVTAECSEEHRYMCVFNYPGESFYYGSLCETLHALLLPTNACISMYIHTYPIAFQFSKDMPKAPLWVCSCVFHSLDPQL